jgi:hypothetical protein
MISVAAAMSDLTRLFLQADKVIEASHPCNWFDSGSVLAADPRRGPSRDHTAVQARPGRLNALGVSRRKSRLYGAFVWACGALNSATRRFPARAVIADSLAPGGMGSSPDLRHCRTCYSRYRKSISIDRVACSSRISFWCPQYFPSAALRVCCQY